MILYLVDSFRLHIAISKCMNKSITIYLRSCFITLICIFILVYSEPKLPPISKIKDANKHVWIRYIAHFGNLNTEGKWINWKIKKGDWTNQFFEPPLSIPSVFYPQLGLYSSHDRHTIKKHLKIISQSHISGLIVDWDGPSRQQFADSDENFIEVSFQLITELAQQFEIKIGIFLTDYYQRTSETIIQDLSYYIKTYSNRSTCLKFNDKPIVFADQSIDPTIIDHFSSHISFFASGTKVHEIFDSYENGFVGFTTFASGLKHSALDDPTIWESLSTQLRSRNMTFVPSVKPGINMSAYNIQLEHKSKSRENGMYYEVQWEAAIGSGADIILINSFNNWIEGTVIEPVESSPHFPLNNDIWAGTDSNYFIDATEKYIRNFTLFK